MFPVNVSKSPLASRKPVQVRGRSLRFWPDLGVEDGGFIASLSSMEFYKERRNSFRRLVDFNIGQGFLPIFVVHETQLITKY